MSASSAHMKVCVVGASGGIGQAFGLLMKVNPYIEELAMYDIERAHIPSKGVAADLSHIDTQTRCVGYCGQDEMDAAIRGSDIIVITAGVTQKPGMSRDDLFEIDAKIVHGIMKVVVKEAPNSIILMITNPVNSLVPLVAEILKKQGLYDWRKVIGVTTLDVVRASTFLSEGRFRCPTDVKVPVVGGHGGETILPLFSQAQPPVHLTEEEARRLDARVVDGAAEVINAKNGSGSATLSTAYGAAKFCNSLLLAMHGQPQTECCYVGGYSKELEFFACPCELGPNGVERHVMPTGLTPFEEERLASAKAKLVGDIERGTNYGSA